MGEKQGMQKLIEEAFNLETAVERIRRCVWACACREATRRQAGACNEARQRQVRDQTCQRVRSADTQQVNVSEGRKLSVHAAPMRKMSGQLRFLGLIMAFFKLSSAGCLRP
jgi:hypothetical protein